MSDYDAIVVGAGHNGLTAAALLQRAGLKTLILEDTAADIPHLVSEIERLRGALGAETVAMMQRHEAEGTLEHPAYKAAVTILNHRHVCRLD